MEDKIGFVYILTNKAFPNLLKIGYTYRTVNERVQELSSATGVPYKFELVHAVETFSPDEKEKKIHKYLSRHRIKTGNKKTEFFKVNIKEAKHIVDMVANPPKPPDPPETIMAPEPPEMTPEKVAIRKEMVNKLLRNKYENRLRNIKFWIEGLKFLLEKENERKRMGFIKRLRTNTPRLDPNIFLEYKRSIQMIEEFEKAYTYEIFMKEHKAVQGIDQVLKKQASETLEKCVGLKVQLQDLNVMADTCHFIPMENFPFKTDYPYYRPPLQRFSWDWCEIEDTPEMRRNFPKSFMYEPISFIREIYYVDFEEFYFPKDRPIYYYSDWEQKKRWKKGRKIWQEEWIKEWWQNADPSGISTSNPFSKT